MIKAVCFDLDDTLIREINSVMFLCLLNDKAEQYWELEKLEQQGLNWIESDHRKARLIKGLPERVLCEQFGAMIQPLRHIEATIRRLKTHHIPSVIITAGPKQVAGIAREKWGFDYSYGSDFQTENGIFTGDITHHIGDCGKIDCVEDYCRKYDLSRHDCLAVGDGSTDIPMFEYCGKSIALNASDSVAQKATCAIQTDDLLDILPLILQYT